MAFDVAGARAAGYSDQEIADHLAKSTPNFNINQARAAGYNDTELVNHLTGSQPSVQPAAKLGSEFAPDDPGFWGGMMVAGGHSVDKIASGLAQAYLGATGATDSTKAALKGIVAERDRIYQPVQDAHPVAAAVGSTLPAMAVPIGGGGMTLGTLGKMAVQGAAVPALQYGTVGERARGAAAGAAGATAGGVVLPGIGTAVGQAAGRAADSVFGSQISPEVMALAQRAQQLGIPVSRAQLSDSTFLKTLASQVEKIPFTGGTQARQAQQAAFNQAVSRTFGEDSPVVNQNLYNTAKTRIGNEFERLSGQNNLQVTPALMGDVNTVIDQADRFGTADSSRIIRNLAGDLRDKLDPTTMTIPGQAYQAADSQMSSLMKSGDPTSVFIGQLRDAVRQGMDHSISPADQAAWMTARSQYRNLKAVRDIVGKAGVDGDISPALLMGRLNSSNAARESMAMGTRGDLGDIAQIGQQFVRDPVPNSGTAQRLVAATLLGGGAGVAGIPAAAGMAVTAATTGRMLNNALNTGASGARAMASQTARGTAAAPATLADLLSNSPASQAGAAGGRTLADLLQQDQK